MLKPERKSLIQTAILRWMAEDCRHNPKAIFKGLDTRLAPAGYQIPEVVKVLESMSTDGLITSEYLGCDERMPFTLTRKGLVAARALG